MSNVVKITSGYFPDPTKGRPVSNGLIYVGLPDLDPSILANQKQLSVRQESGTIVNVSQPVYTSAGGVPQYLDSPVTLLVDGEYSIKVLDSNGSQVYYSPSSSGETTYLLSESSCDLAQLVSGIGAVNHATIRVDCASIIASGTTVTVTSNISLEIIKGGSIDGVSGGGTETLTINGPLISGNYHIFGENLTVTLGDLSAINVSPRWFGCVADSETDDTVNLVRMFDSMTSGGSVLLDALYYGEWIYINNSNITIRGVSLDCGFKVIADNSLTGSNLVRLDDQSNILIDGITFDGNIDNVRFGTRDNGTSLIRFGSSTDITVVNCKFVDNVYTALQLTGKYTLPSGPITYTERVSVSNNHFLNTDCGVITQGGNTGNRFIAVTGNTFEGGTSDGVAIWGEEDEHITVAGNTMTDKSGAGVVVKYADTVSVVGNTVYNCQGGIKLFADTPPTNCTVVGNTVDTTSEYGISGRALNSTISGNAVINTTEEGINFTGTNYNSIFSDNTVENSGESGIRIQDSDNCIIANNAVIDCAQDGSDGIRTVDLTNSIISGNVVRDTNGTPLTSIGISIRGSSTDGVTVSGNRVDNVLTYGFYTDLAENVLMHDNYAQNAGTESYRTVFDTTTVYGHNNYDESGEYVYNDYVGSSIALAINKPTRINSSSGTLALTLADGTGYGQHKFIVMSVSGNNADVTIAHHETSDNEVARFDAVDEYLLLVWTGTEWATVSASCTFP